MLEVDKMGSKNTPLCANTSKACFGAIFHAMLRFISYWDAAVELEQRGKRDERGRDEEVEVEHL